MESSPTSNTPEPRDAPNWAQRVAALKVGQVPAGAVNLNVQGRRLIGALQGFGPLWQKTYRLVIHGTDVAPTDVVRVWKERFPDFHPPESRFYPSLAGVQPGEVLLINAQVSGMPVYTGVMVLYADDESFTVMTAEGLPEAGWNTFSASREDGHTVLQIQSVMRTNDPIYELGYRLMNGAKTQEKIWGHVLTSLAAALGGHGQVEITKRCLDPKMQWRQAKNVWHNAIIRSVLYQIAAPVRWLRQRKA